MSLRGVPFQQERLYVGKATPHTRQLGQLDFCCRSPVYIENTSFFRGVGGRSGVGLISLVIKP